jgi:hypothetical protein
MILFAVLLLVAVVVLIAVGVAAEDRKQRLQPPTHLPPELPPSPPKPFQKRPPPAAPKPARRGAERNIRLRGRVKKREVKPDFKLPCRVTGRLMRECGCLSCSNLRKKFGV